MKSAILLVISICSSMILTAQNPDIIGTWYLEAYTFDLADPIPITTENFPQNPSLTINADLSYEGLGACNTFSGNIVFIEDFEYESIHFIPTTMNCGNPDYNTSEGVYFDHFNQALSPFVYIIEGGGQLNWEIAPGFGLQFKNTPSLGVSDIDKNTFFVFPNPSSEKINITSNGVSISKITLFNALGQRIPSEMYTGQTIDVSSLKSGLYFLEIRAEGKKTLKKFIKD